AGDGGSPAVGGDGPCRRPDRQPGSARPPGGRDRTAHSGSGRLHWRGGGEHTIVRRQPRAAGVPSSSEATVMPKVLIVDDSAFDRQRAGKLLELRPGEPALEFAGELQVVYASDGQEALTVIEAEKPDLVVTDMQMPGMDGLNLVRRVRIKYPLIPVILMTSQGSEEIAIEALRRGAASYVPKRNLPHPLRATPPPAL